jgi:ubiquinone/menaquinone biosynthesis C-methylase UbiE
MSVIEFTDEIADRLESLYMTSDVIAQREATLKHVNLSHGDSVLDIGSGPGFLCESVAALVGAAGKVVGVDISRDLVLRSARRNSRPWLSFRTGDATALEDPDATYDVVLCTQVAEYIADVDAAIAETRRVLKPGGVAVFVATDWAGVIWHSDNPTRMSEVMSSWEAHCAHPRLPRSLRRHLIDAGLEVHTASVFPILNLEWDDDSYSKGISMLIHDFVAARSDVDAESLSSWYDELKQLSDSGRYFFSSSRFIFRATRPH